MGGTGTLEFLAVPLDGGSTIEFDAVGEIRGPDGWQFDLHFSATVP
jgi:hypothetical protein